jgi:hypothetical protein
MRMRRTKIAILALAPFSIFANAWAEDFCARAPDLTALQVAAVQQELMVAAFTCNDTGLYNTFVITYRKDLQASDAALQAFFMRKDRASGFAAYHTYKTKLANISSLRSARDGRTYCSLARIAFHAALNEGKKTLAQFVMTQPASFDPNYNSCGDEVAGGGMATPKRTPLTAMASTTESTMASPYIPSSKSDSKSAGSTTASAGHNDNAAPMRTDNRGSPTQQRVRRRYDTYSFFTGDPYARSPRGRGYGNAYGNSNPYGEAYPRYSNPYNPYWYVWPPQFYDLRRR